MKAALDNRRRKKMCENKVSFYNRKRAELAAQKYGQRVYECPICFCFHCTSKDDWRDEFVPIDRYERAIKELVSLKESYKKYPKYKRFYGVVNNAFLKITADTKKVGKIIKRGKKHENES